MTVSPTVTVSHSSAPPNACTLPLTCGKFVSTLALRHPVSLVVMGQKASLMASQAGENSRPKTPKRTIESIVLNNLIFRKTLEEE